MASMGERCGEMPGKTVDSALCLWSGGQGRRGGKAESRTGDGQMSESRIEAGGLAGAGGAGT